MQVQASAVYGVLFDENGKRKTCTCTAVERHRDAMTRCHAKYNEHLNQPTTVMQQACVVFLHEGCAARLAFRTHFATVQAVDGRSSWFRTCALFVTFAEGVWVGCVDAAQRCAIRLAPWATWCRFCASMYTIAVQPGSSGGDCEHEATSTVRGILSGRVETFAEPGERPSLTSYAQGGMHLLRILSETCL